MCNVQGHGGTGEKKGEEGQQKLCMEMPIMNASYANLKIDLK